MPFKTLTGSVLNHSIETCTLFPAEVIYSGPESKLILIARSINGFLIRIDSRSERKFTPIIFSFLLLAIPVSKRNVLSSSDCPSIRPLMIIFLCEAGSKSPNFQTLFSEIALGSDSSKRKPKGYSAFTRRLRIT